MLVEAERVSLSLTPRGELRPVATAEHGLSGAAGLELRAGFERAPDRGLLLLGTDDADVDCPVVAFWQRFAQRFVAELCTLPGLEQAARAPEVQLSDGELDRLLLAAPPMRGGEYLSRETLRARWGGLHAALAAELDASGQDVQAFLRERNPAWNLVGRIHFHLAERKRDASAPFAFLATYTTSAGKGGRAKHLPLGKALEEYAGARNKQKLLALLEPVQRAAERSPFVKELVDAGSVFHPLAWDADQAYRFLKDVQALEASGVVVKVPDWWRKRSRPRVQLTVGSAAASKVGLDALLDFSVDLVLDGEALSDAEREAILAGSEGLALVKGRWVEVDHDRLGQLLAHWRTAEAAVGDGLTFAEGMRLLAGASLGGDREPELAEAEPWTLRVAGPWLTDALAKLRAPVAADRQELGGALHATLRPYQAVGVSWLWTLYRLGLGGCLADDMGLGKTIQVIALLLRVQRDAPAGPNLLVVPASLLANWSAELGRFAPSLSALVAHPSVTPRAELKRLSARKAASHDVVITSYGYVSRLSWAKKTRWNLVVLDEAQAIKNPGTRQTRACKALDSNVRLALTGTPIENRLSDLWSLFDFTNPGLLGGAKAFSRFARQLDGDFGPLRRLVQPYVLRRLKSDKAVVADLPDKTEVPAYCSLSKTQAALYEESVRELRRQLEAKDGIERRGIVLAFLTRFKQICNHPAHWLGQDEWPPSESGKLARLAELCESIASRQEKVLVFTQFRQACAPLAEFLAGVFGRPGLVLHGGTRVKQRQALVTRFQEDEDAPFFVLSLKAGGTGLNLTAASHVIHFDRWWNPAVEDQATDRAYRIGQRQNVLVHKFVCRGTVEERIEELLLGKRQLSAELLAGDGGALLTELPDDELLRLVALDLESALGEA